jgi:hypothetical protein
MNRIVIAISVLAATFIMIKEACATNLDVQWNDGATNNDWGNPTNWSGNVLPSTGLGTTGDKIHINLNDTNRAIYSAATGNNTYQTFRIGDSAAGELQVTGGLLSSDGTSVSYIGNGGQMGTLNQSAGTVSFGGYMEVGMGANSVGNINLSGGTLISARNGTIGGVPGVSMGFGDGTGAHGNCILSGGELQTRTGILLGANGGLGRFEVDGAGIADVGTDNSADDGFWVQNSGSTLAAYVTNGALGSIYVANLVSGSGPYNHGNVIFMPGSLLEVGFHGSPAPGAWDLMKWDGTLLTNGLAFAPGTDTNWSFAFVTNGSASGPNTLRIIYIAANLTPPTGIVAVPGNSQVTLRWSAESGATNYFLKRAASSGGPYTFTNSTTGINFTDTGLINGVTYYYVVSAAITNGVTGNSFEVRATPYGGDFVHPGVMHAYADLERMRTNVLAGNQPWYRGYTNMLADSHSSSAYAMEGPLTTITRDAVHPVLPTAFQDDCGAAYQNALLWYLTGDPAHANKAIQILDAWSTTCTNTSGSDVRLACGLQGYKFITAAELIRYTGASWSQTEISTCSNFIRTVILPQNRMYGGGNWGQCGAASAMAAGVFLNDEAVFNEAMNCLKYGAPTECDLGVINYIKPGGWTDESDRDIGHWGLGLDDICQAYWTAWCQGIDLWTFLNNRLLTGHEYLAYFNANNTTNGGLSGLTNVLVPYVAGSQCDGTANSGLISQTSGAINQLGTWFDLWAQAFNPYQNMIGIAAPWSSNAASMVLPANYYDRDHIAFGNLVGSMPPRTAGLPIMPSGLMAIWNNAQVALAWNTASGATAYNVKRATFRGGPYTNIATVVATSYADDSVSNDVLYFYEVSATNSVGETVNSGLASAYPSAAVPAAPTGVNASTTSHVRIDLSWGAVLGATSYNVRRSTSNGGPYTTIATGVGTTFLTYADTGLTSGTPYYYVISATNNVGESSNSAQASATTLPALPSSWGYSDAGYQTTPGNATYSNGTFTVKGAGLDYGGDNSDAFGFAYLNMTGPGTIIARYRARTNYSGLNKAGLTMRESLAEGSKHAFLLFDGTSTNYMIYRGSTGGNGSSSGSAHISGVLPEWLKLDRTGNAFTGSVSSDGTNWTVVSTVTISMNNTLLIGFAVCSRNNGALDTSVFDNVSVTGIWPALPGTPANLIAVPGDASAFLNWSAATNATGYNLKSASTSAGPYTTIATNWSGLIFTNTGLVDGTPYYYEVSGTNYFGESTNSSPASVIPVSFASPQLTFQTTGSQLDFTWPSDHLGWELQAQTNSPGAGLGTNWSTITGSDTTNQWWISIDNGQGSEFYRLIYQ